jgi:hypothetical protein
MAIVQRAFLLALAGLPTLAAAAQNDIFPTDHIALPDGYKNVAIYALSSTVAGPYKNGSKTAAGEISSNTYALRIGKHYSFGENDKYTFGPLAVLSWADATPNATLQPTLGGSTSGYGDLRLGSAVWFHIDRENREYAMVNASVILPTGTYDKTRALNFGENRYRYVLAAGWMRPLSEKWVIDLAPEVVFYSDNTEFLGNKRYAQAVSYALNGILRYRVTPYFHVYGGAIVNGGGATTLNGNAYTGAPNTTRVNAGMMLIEVGKQQLHLRVGQDVSGDNGFLLAREIGLRYSAFFQ